MLEAVAGQAAALNEGDLSGLGNHGKGTRGSVLGLQTFQLSQLSGADSGRDASFVLGEPCRS